MIEYKKKFLNDEMLTPSYAIRPLLKYLDKNMVIWECTDFGNSNITRVLRENGFKVVSTWKDDVDFLEDTVDFDFDMIVTNPPYSIKNDFIKKCYEYGKPFCLLLPITSLEGTARGALYRKYGLELLVFDKRCNFEYDINSKNNWFNTSWFCWKVLPEKLIFEELNKEEDVK